MGGTLKTTLLLALGLWAARAGAVSVVYLPSADTSLMEVAPSNNNGGQAWVLSGRTQNGPRTRGLFKFDLTAIPTNASVLSAAVVLEVTRVPRDGQANAPFGLYRMLRPWGEGDKVGIDPPGQGLVASPGEATWLHAFHPTNEWSAPGGALGVDFFGFESSSQFIEGEGAYRFETTPLLVADVQEWANQPESNHGWMLLCDDEDTIFTGRRFGSREEENAYPRLEIEYLVPPRIASASAAGNQFAFSFDTWPGQNYEVEFRDALSFGDWHSLTNVGLVTNAAQVVIVDTVTGPQRYYRVVSF